MVVAKIEAIDLEKPWYYNACNFCKRKIVRQGDGFEETCNIFNITLYTTAKTCKKDFQHAIHWYGRL